jgi:Photosynthesis system II assembly factor YCF48
MDFDRVLRKAMARRTNAPTMAQCLDAETLAAWSDGSLSRRERDAAEAHAADCDRCLSILATLTRTLPPTPQRSWTRLLSIRWIVPLTAATTAAVVWLAVQPRMTQAPATTTAQRDSGPSTSPSTPSSQAAPAPTNPPAGPTRDRRVASETAKRQVSNQDKAVAITPDAELRKEVFDSTASNRTREAKHADGKLEQQPADKRLADRAVVPLRAETGAAAERAAAPAAPPAAPEPRRFAQAQERTLEIPSPDVQIRWRIRGTIVERTANGGQTWQPRSTGTSIRLAAGSSPSSSVCWLAGANGTVLLTTDGGETWQLLPSPDAADLVAITAGNNSQALVTTVGGRVYRTQDAGRTWTLQEPPSEAF